MKSLYPPQLQSKIHVVHDGIEHPALFREHSFTHRGTTKTPLNAVLVTSAAVDYLPVIPEIPNWLHVTIVGRYPIKFKQKIDLFRRTFVLKKGMKRKWNYIKFICNKQITCMPWSASGVYTALQNADFGIIPIETNSSSAPEGQIPVWTVKSENRLTLKMAMGLPVIASPIPAYLPVVEHGINGYLAESKTDWMSHLTQLRDPELRKTIGHNARKTVLEKYSIEAQASKLIKILKLL
jgi:glycosyltransferase involved in cell wall biosynthesis